MDHVRVRGPPEPRDRARAPTRSAGRRGYQSRRVSIDIPLAAELAQARTQMALTLGFHIVLASLGVAFPAMMLIANYRGLRKNDPDALRRQDFEFIGEQTGPIPPAPEKQSGP